MIKIKDLPGRVAALQKKAATKAKADAVKAAKQGSPFASLTPAEKDDLLYVLAVRAGLIEED
jgi:hypothetical protein